MLNKDEFLIFIFICVCVLFFLVGYLLGQHRSFNGVSNDEVGRNKSIIRSETTKNNISIDDTKYVVDIKTTGLEKKYDSLGETKQSSEDITGSINKLKQLKG
jgi:DNA polymerase III alpha subunit (gram-positive type)